MTTLVRITLQGNVEWVVKITPETLRRSENLKPGTIWKMNRKVGDVQIQRIYIRPYYRRIINDELHIFAVQVTPKEVRDGK
jgi:hypothetical protein